MGSVGCHLIDCREHTSLSGTQHSLCTKGHSIRCILRDTDSLHTREGPHINGTYDMVEPLTYMAPRTEVGSKLFRLRKLILPAAIQRYSEMLVRMGNSVSEDMGHCS